jgi:hypothetical protein
MECFQGRDVDYNEPPVPNRRACVRSPIQSASLHPGEIEWRDFTSNSDRQRDFIDGDWHISDCLRALIGRGSQTNPQIFQRQRKTIFYWPALHGSARGCIYSLPVLCLVSVHQPWLLHFQRRLIQSFEGLHMGVDHLYFRLVYLPGITLRNLPRSKYALKSLTAISKATAAKNESLANRRSQARISSSRVSQGCVEE